MTEGRTELDTELRSNLGLMNEMFDNIIRDANIPRPDVPSVDLEFSQDYGAMGEMLLGKLAAIEKCCDAAAASTQKKYDARAIRDKIAVKRRQLAELEAENAALVETAKRQEKALRQMNQGGDEAIEAQQNVMKLRNQLQAAQKEIKVLGFDDLKDGLNPEWIGLKGSPTNVFQSFGKQLRAPGRILESVSADEAVAAIMEKLIDRHII